MATKQKKFGLESIKWFYKIIITAVKSLIAAAVSEVKAALGSALTYKGSVADYDSLPKEGMVKGDTYNVVAAHGNTPAGTNYAWDGEKWDPLGGDIDLSGLASKAEMESALEDKLDSSVYESDKGDFETKENAEKTYQKISDMDDYVKDEDIEDFLTPDDFEEYSESEIQQAVSSVVDD